LRGISKAAEELLDFQEGPCIMELAGGLLPSSNPAGPINQLKALVVGEDYHSD
jgi:hypothetical protein